MTTTVGSTSPGSAAAVCASARKVRGFDVIEAVIGRFPGLVDEFMRCIETDLDSSVESADMDSREMFLELPMLDSPELVGCDNAMFQDHLNRSVLVYAKPRNWNEPKSVTTEKESFEVMLTYQITIASDYIVHDFYAQSLPLSSACDCIEHDIL